MRTILLALAALSCAALAHAELGGNISSIENDRVHMNIKAAARQSPSSTGSYTVYEITLPSGTIVRQYVSTVGGVIFAVAWSGPFVPDLQQILGSNFNKMISRQAGQVAAGRRFIIQHYSDLVVESGGHPRSFMGRAYLPDALPDGFAVQDIQ
ncbi:MAG: DUF2844 domain-containing protein [Sulfuricaulis sp.]